MVQCMEKWTRRGKPPTLFPGGGWRGNIRGATPVATNGLSVADSPQKLPRVTENSPAQLGGGGRWKEIWARSSTDAQDQAQIGTSRNAKPDRWRNEALFESHSEWKRRFSETSSLVFTRSSRRPWLYRSQREIYRQSLCHTQTLSPRVFRPVFYPVALVHSFERLLDLVIPIAERHDHPFQCTDKVQRDALSDPKALQAPAMEGQVDPEGQSATVIADDVDSRPNMLSAHAPKASPAATVEAVRDLEQGHKRQDFGRQLHHSAVVVEDLRKVISSTHEDDAHSSTKQHAEPCRGVRSSGSSLGILCSQQIPNPRARRHTYSKWNGVHDLIRSHDDTLRSKGDRAKPSSRQRDYLERPPFRPNMHNPQNGKPRENT